MTKIIKIIKIFRSKANTANLLFIRYRKSVRDAILSIVPGYRWEKVKDKVKGIDGLLSSSAQEQWLFEQALKLPDSVTIVEIGGYKGKSTTCLALGCIGSSKKVYTIDTFDGNETDFTGKGRRSFYHIWCNNIKRNRLEKYVTPIRKKSQEAGKEWDGAIDFIFIDGSHLYQDVLADFNNFYPFVVSGGIIAMHDVDEVHVGSTRVWHEVAKVKLKNKGNRGNLYYGIKP